MKTDCPGPFQLDHPMWGLQQLLARDSSRPEQFRTLHNLRHLCFRDLDRVLLFLQCTTGNPLNLLLDPLPYRLLHRHGSSFRCAPMGWSHQCHHSHIVQEDQGCRPHLFCIQDHQIV